MKSPRVYFALAVLAVSFAYAILRYHILKGVAWAQFPLFISNKAIALTSVALIAISYSIGALAHIFPRMFTKALPARKFFGLFGFALASLHGLISLLIFNPAYYPKFFEGSGKLNLTGELSLLFGVASFALFLLVAITSVPSIERALGEKRWLSFQHLGYLGLVAVLGHVFTMGISGWTDSSSWPGGLLPISLIAFVIALCALLLRAISMLFATRR